MICSQSCARADLRPGGCTSRIWSAQESRAAPYTCGSRRSQACCHTGLRGAADTGGGCASGDEHASARRPPDLPRAAMRRIDAVVHAFTWRGTRCSSNDAHAARRSGADAGAEVAAAQPQEPA